MAATVAASQPRIEIVGERRRAHDAAFRARMVAASQQPDICVRDLARRHGICPSLIYRWRRSLALPVLTAPVSAPSVAAPPAQARVDVPSPAHPAQAVVAERALEFVPIGVFGRADDESSALIAGPPTGAAPAASGATPLVAAPAMQARPGLIEIDLADGTRLRVDAFVNERALRRVLSVLKAVA
jgi:transposase